MCTLSIAHGQQAKFQRSLDKNAKTKDMKDSLDISLESGFMSRWVKNCSEQLASDPDLSLLKKGLSQPWYRRVGL